MCDTIYDIDLYIPYTQKGLIDKQKLKDLCRQYDVNHSDCWSGSGANFCSERLDQSVGWGTSYSIAVKQSQLLDFLHQLPKDITIESVVYTPNFKSNAWLQTNDLVLKYYNPEDDEPCFHPVYIPEKREYHPNNYSYTEKIDVATQTEPYDIDDLGSESGTMSNSSKYDTDYSLEMWDYYQHESVVYTHPLMSRNDGPIMKHNLTPFEETIVTFCKTFEHNLEKYLIS